MIEVAGCSFSYGEKKVLQKLNLSLPDTGTVLLTGDSGCGKSTLLHILAGLLRPGEGTVTGLGQRRIGVVFQEDRLLPWRTVIENAALAGQREKAEELLCALGLQDSLYVYPKELSGGMSRRVAIARALAYSDDIVLLDEPFNGLDEELRQKTMVLIRERTKLRILSSHIQSDYPFIAPDRVVTLTALGEETKID